MQKCFAVKPEINGVMSYLYIHINVFCVNLGILDVARRTFSETVGDIQGKLQSSINFRFIYGYTEMATQLSDSWQVCKRTFTIKT